MKKKLAKVLSLIIAITFVASCASIVSKSEYPVAINSNPDGAKITITNRKSQVVFDGKTPTIVTLNAGDGYFKGQDYFVKFEKEGYETHTAQVNRYVDGWYALGNLFFGGLIGWLIVDPATGAMWTLEDLHADLEALPECEKAEEPGDKTGEEPKAESISDKHSRVYIMTVDEIPEHLRSKMVRLN